MAMTLRFPTELDEQLQQLADDQHTSKHALVIRAVEEHIMRELKTKRVLESIDETSRDYAELMRRLEDA
jgi:predicted transcriptional regulator